MLLIEASRALPVTKLGSAGATLAGADSVVDVAPTVLSGVVSIATSCVAAVGGATGALTGAGAGAADVDADVDAAGAGLAWKCHVRRFVRKSNRLTAGLAVARVN